jgi:hypothetical protein
VSDQIDIRNLQAIRDARAAVMEYREVARGALGEAIAEADRSVRFITGELRSRWEQERRRQERLLNHLKSELARAELQSQGQGGMVSTREERAKVDRCQRAIHEADRKIARIRQWSVVLERELGMLRGQTQGLGRSSPSRCPESRSTSGRRMPGTRRGRPPRSPTSEPACRPIQAAQEPPGTSVPTRPRPPGVG